jgi:hypothetical protein
MHSQQHNERSANFHQRPDLLGLTKKNVVGAPTKRWTLRRINQTIRTALSVVAMTAFVWLMQYVLDHIVTSEGQHLDNRFRRTAGLRK